MKLYEFSLKSLAVASIATVLSACTGVTEPSSSSQVTVSSDAVSSAVSSIMTISSSSETVVSSSSEPVVASSSSVVVVSSSSEAPSSSSVPSSAAPSSSSVVSSSSVPSSFSVENGAEQYVVLCSSCHEPDGSGRSDFPAINDPDNYSKVGGKDNETLANYILNAMINGPWVQVENSCGIDCSRDIAAFMLAGFPELTGGGTNNGAPISATAQANRVAEGKQAYSEKGCGLCHTDEGGTLVPFGSGDNVKLRSLKNCPSCTNYGALVASITNTMPKSEKAYGPETCVGDCAKSTADYIWVKILGGTLTDSGGFLPPVSGEIGLDTLRVKSYDAIKSDYERVFGEVPAGLEASEGAFRQTPDFWYQERALGAVSLNVLANAAVEACRASDLPAANATAVRSACEGWAQSMWLRDATTEELDSCVDTALNLTSGLGDATKQVEFACASMMISIPALTY